MEGPQTFPQLILIWLALLGEVAGAIRLIFAPKPSLSFKITFVIWAAVCIFGSIGALRSGNPDTKLWSWGLLILAVSLLGWFLRHTAITTFLTFNVFRSLAKEVRKLAENSTQRREILESARQLLSHCKDRDELHELLAAASQTRPAGPNDVKGALKAVHFTEGGQSAEEQESKKVQLADSLCDEKLFSFSRRGFELGALSRRFELKFDIFRFLAGTPNDGVSSLRAAIRKDIDERFCNQGIHTLVYIDRDGTEPAGKFFEEIKGLGKIEICRYLPKSRRKHGSTPDTTSLESFSQACGGKKILIVDPLLLDYELDQAIEEIGYTYGGKVENVLVMFEVLGLPQDRFRCREILSITPGSNGLRGQVVLDLGEFSGPHKGLDALAAAGIPGSGKGH